MSQEDEIAALRREVEALQGRLDRKTEDQLDATSRLLANNAALRARVADLEHRLNLMLQESLRGFIHGHARTTPDWAEANARYEAAIRAALDRAGKESDK